MMEEWDRAGGGGWLIHIRVWVGGREGGYYLFVYFLFLFVLLSFGLSCPVSSLSE